MADNGHFLGRLELFGFKSFAKRTILEFGAGITTLVGPNGCGKSNIIDAIRWVLGEQSGRSARTRGVDEVIFNGAGKGRPVGMAEVAITFDNRARLLPLDYSEVRIRRRLYRSGENEYSLNNQPAQLKDIRALLHDTGIGKSAYSILEQGRIDQLLHGRPEDRRSIFEEAAGISRYKSRNRDAQRKLHQTLENMRLAQEMLSEVEQNHARLKRQSEVTLHYRELRTRQRTIEIDIDLLHFRSLSAVAKRHERAVEQQEAAVDTQQEKLETQRARMRSALDGLNVLESELTNLQNELNRGELERTRLNDRIESWKERRREFERRIAHEEERLHGYDERIKQLRHEQEQKTDHLAELQAEADRISTDITRFKALIAATGDTLRGNEARHLAIRKDIKGCEQEREGLISEMSTLAGSIVTQIDEHIKPGNYSATLRTQTERELDETLARLHARCMAMHDLLSAAAATGVSEPARSTKLIADLHTEMEVVVQEIKLCTEQVRKHREYMPAFLDDLLSASGAISRRHSLQEQLEALQKRVDAHRAEMDMIAEQNRRSRATIEKSRPTLEGLRVSHAQTETMLESRREELTRAAGEIKRQQQQKGAQRLVADEERRRAAELGDQVAAAERQRAQLDTRRKELQTELAGRRNQIDQQAHTLQHEEKQIADLHRQLEQVREKRQQLQIEMARSSTRVADMRAGFYERHGRYPQEYTQHTDTIQSSAAQLGRELKKIEAQITELGDINAMAIEEFKATDARYKLLRDQCNDLTAAYTDLQRVTEYMTKNAIESFEHTLKEIRTHFHAMFRRLFGGGRADIKLTDPDSILESGIDIVVHPPGRRAANIELLSGGERSLVSAALLLGIFMVRPSPFYCFDEIDAALDDANIGLFTNLLYEFSHRSQFILISHNKKTIAYARTLYGITMEESGVSKLVALRLRSGDTDSVAHNPDAQEGANA